MSSPDTFGETVGVVQLIQKAPEEVVGDHDGLAGPAEEEGRRVEGPETDGVSGPRAGVLRRVGWRRRILPGRRHRTRTPAPPTTITGRRAQTDGGERGGTGPCWRHVKPDEMVSSNSHRSTCISCSRYITSSQPGARRSRATAYVRTAGWSKEGSINPAPGQSRSALSKASAPAPAETEFRSQLSLSRNLGSNIM